MDGWSAADPDGLCSLRLDDPRRASLRGKRLRRAAQAGQALALDAWPEAERRLLQEWLKRGHARPLKRDTLYAMAGPSRAMAADRVLERLLRLGHIETEEKLEHGSWWLQRISFLNPLALYAQLGLEAPEQARQALEAARIEAQTLHHPALQALAAGLAQGTPTRVALQRHQLLQSLDQWQQEGRSGTWRDFGLFARGDTKAITDTERKWLEAGLGLDLDSFHIQSHTPLLLIRASGQLHLPGGHFSLNLLPGFSALTPDSLRLCQGGSQAPACWLVLENLSAFEHVARHLPDGHGALWLPGYPPGWWREAVGLLLRHLPAPARIACDPDPDGIAIALQAGELWDAAGLGWEAWHMHPADLDALPAHRPLDARDRQVLERLKQTALPAPLHALAAHLDARGHKGEQEGLFVRPPGQARLSG